MKNITKDTAGQVSAIAAADDDEIEIDLGEIFFALRSHLLAVLSAVIIGGSIGFLISHFALTPTYTSTSMLYVMSKETTITSLTDLQIGTQLTTDYQVLLKSRTVMENTIQKLGLADMDYLELRKMITVDNPQDTRILDISVVDTDPQRAKQITDAVAESASEYIADIMEQDPPKIIEYGEVPMRKTGPHTGRNTAVAALIGFLLAAAWITYTTITNDAIRTEDDIEKNFGLPVLAAIPKISDLGGKGQDSPPGRKRGSKKEGKA
jgi:capsular polysaccharide biosynthesis protein